MLTKKTTEVDADEQQLKALRSAACKICGGRFVSLPVARERTRVRSAGGGAVRRLGSSSGGGARRRRTSEGSQILIPSNPTKYASPTDVRRLCAKSNAPRAPSALSVLILVLPRLRLARNTRQCGAF